jgi:hypothetical protein
MKIQDGGKNSCSNFAIMYLKLILLVVREKTDTFNLVEIMFCQVRLYKNTITFLLDFIFGFIFEVQLNFLLFCLMNKTLNRSKFIINKKNDLHLQRDKRI